MVALDGELMKEITKKSFANGVVYLLHTDDGFPIEVTDTFLPIATKDAIGGGCGMLWHVQAWARKNGKLKKY